MKKLWSIIFMTAISVLFVSAYSYGNSKIIGTVIDKTTNVPLPGANVYLEKTNMGAAADIDGSFAIENVPPGKYVLVVKYLGYESETFELTVADNAIVQQDAELIPMVIEGGETIVVTAQAEGQIQAINQQITSSTVKNIVSSSKIQELPEANAAEAVGRIPGISLQREGGEGNKVVIRGLSPQFSKISLNGVSMAATGNEDRSVDLSMISPNILEGIVVSKTAMADQEADQLGGTVDFILRKAKTKPTLNATLQGGYNGLHNEINNYNYILGGGMRFFDNQLGVLVQGNLEKTDRSDNSASAGHAYLETTDFTYANTLSLRDISRTIKRRGGVVVLDYESPLSETKIKLSNTINSIETDEYQKTQGFDPTLTGARTNSVFYQGNYFKEDLLTGVHALDIEQTVGGFLITATVSYSRSKSEIPEQYILDASQTDVWDNGFSPINKQYDPFDLPNYTTQDIRSTQLDDLTYLTKDNLEEESGLKFNIEYKFNIGIAAVNLKVGSQFKHKYKKYDLEQANIPISYADMFEQRVLLAEYLGVPVHEAKDGYLYYADSPFPYYPFVESNYDPGDFKAGSRYTIRNVPDKSVLINSYKFLENLKYNSSVTDPVDYNYITSARNDYSGNEDYLAAYILPTITFGNKLVTFIPGFRYEKNETEYTANRLTNTQTEKESNFTTDVYTAKRLNEYYLPMIHLKYSPLEWFDVLASYTETIARPDYDRIIPFWQQTQKSITWNNPYLKPAESKNIDLFLTFHTPQIGLITIGGFQKRITGFLYEAANTPLFEESQLNPEWPTNVALGGTVTEYANNPNTAELWGIETEWQSNLMFLPGILKSLVLTLNYTYTHSNLVYPKAVAVWDRTNPRRPVIVGLADNSYEDRLLDQPTHIFNASLGFDYKGFSIRGSVQYKSDVFSSTNRIAGLRQTTDPITLLDMQVKQELPIEGLQVFMNMNNLTKVVEQVTTSGDGIFANRYYYGLTGSMGISYNLN